MSVCDHCQYCSYCHSDVSRLKNAIKELNDENDKLNFDLTKTVLDAKNEKHFLKQGLLTFMHQRDEARARGDGLAADLATCVRLRDQALVEIERLTLYLHLSAELITLARAHGVPEEKIEAAVAANHAG